jgi:hypothetical protein
MKTTKTGQAFSVPRFEPGSGLTREQYVKTPQHAEHNSSQLYSSFNSAQSRYTVRIFDGCAATTETPATDTGIAHSGRADHRHSRQVSSPCTGVSRTLTTILLSAHVDGQI